MQTSFIPYLVLNDYLPTIQSGQLNNQILDPINQGGEQERKFAESFAIGKVRSVLSSFFDLSLEITPTLPFKFNKVYHPGDRIILDFPDWIASPVSEDEEAQTKYEIGDCVIYQLIAYCCSQENSDQEFISNNWTAIGNQYDIFYIPYPYPLFSLEIKDQRGIQINGFYKVGDYTYWENHTWQAKRGTLIGSHQAIEQVGRTYFVPQSNQFPNQINQTQWTDFGESIIQSKLPNEELYWTFGDNRDPLMVQAIIDISIWKLHKRISPLNIPKLREDSFKSTWEWLKDVQKGEQTISCPALQPTQVDSISWGSDIKKNNKIWG